MVSAELEAPLTPRNKLTGTGGCLEGSQPFFLKAKNKYMCIEILVNTNDFFFKTS